MKTCVRCGVSAETRSLFCACGKLYSLPDLQSVDVAGFVGVAHSLSPSIEKFWASGDPSVFASGQ